MKIINLKIDVLKPYDKNPRKNKEAVKYVAESIKEFGFKQPIVIDKNNVIVCGHTRLLAAKQLGLKEVPCILADDLTEEQINAYRLVDNKTNEFAEWDNELLKEELFKLPSLNMKLFGFEEEQKEEQIAEEDNYEEPEQLEPIVKKGQVWQLGVHRLMCGDSTKKEDVDKLMDGKKADLVFTDPPYGDSVPYFEQSVIWNAWLRLEPKYTDEIVISDSNKRSKGINEFENDINKSFSEIRRVLKDNKFFSLTFHSLSGMEWKAISNACVFNNFIVVDYEWLEQKTYPPRQLNRLKSIKGDVLVTFQKKPEAVFLKVCDDLQLIELVKDFITKQIQLGIVDTNGIMMAIMEWVLREMIMIGDVDVFKVLNENYHIGEDGNWSLNN